MTELTSYFDLKIRAAELYDLLPCGRRTRPG